MLLRLGAISYALYLFHVPVARVAERVIAPASLPAALLYLTLMLGGSLMLAAAVYTWLERPMIARGKRWSPGHRLGVAVAP
jgi:peptidoglycan/LPS O-acetylase OafA/YrhL